MFERLFPRSLENGYLGHPLAKWVLVLLTAVTFVRSLIHIFLHDGGAQSIATIPLDSFTPGGAGAVVAIFALWGLSQLLIAVVYLAVLWRYQALIPFVYLLFVAEYVGRLLIGIQGPSIAVERPPGAVANLVAPVLGLAMLVLSLRARKVPDRGSAS